MTQSETPVRKTRQANAISGVAIAARSYVKSNPVAGLKVSPRGTPLHVLVLAMSYGGMALVIGLTTGILKPGLPSIAGLLFFPPALLLYPALFEEFIFRGLLLPRSLADASPRRRAMAVAMSTLAFVAIHPLNAMTVSRSDTSLFTRPAFLLIVALLGGVCGYAYLRTQSLWTPIAIHWATVVIWNLFLGRPG